MLQSVTPVGRFIKIRKHHFHRVISQNWPLHTRGRSFSTPGQNVSSRLQRQQSKWFNGYKTKSAATLTWTQALQRRRDPGQMVLVILGQLKILLRQYNKQKFRATTGLAEETAKETISEFQRKVQVSLEDWLANRAAQGPPQIYTACEDAYLSGGESELHERLKQALQAYIANLEFTESDIREHAELADLRYPYEWYPSTRAMNREIHLHIGPTNSGKTYHALKRLEQAESGVYAGPLRLLAHEVYGRLNALGKKCNLITGDEMIMAEGLDVVMNSCTVEMVPLATRMDVAVIDEIQMIADDHRGWAWTQALLGLKAKELHLCGEERVLKLVQDMAAAIGEKLIVHRYKRLSPLEVMNTSLQGRLDNLRKGDCVVAFSRTKIHTLKKRIELMTGKKVATVYGALPPEIRNQQAKLFNDPENDYDILVASDAIGMGLNLSIKRIIFETTIKNTGSGFHPMEISQIKQIAGRAGRYRTAADAINESSDKDTANAAENIEDSLLDIQAPTNVGLVTSLEQIDQQRIHAAIASTARPLTSAGVIPPDQLIIRFSSYFPPRTPLSYILLRMREICKMTKRFHLCSFRDHLKIADAIQPIEGLTISDRLTFCAAPASLKDPYIAKIVVAYAACVSNQSGGALLDIKELSLEILEKSYRDSPLYLGQLESLHRALVLYLWLSYRFSGIFVSQAMAIHVKRLVEKEIDDILSEITQRAAIRKQSPQEWDHETKLQDLLNDSSSEGLVKGNESSLILQNPVEPLRHEASL